MNRNLIYGLVLLFVAVSCSREENSSLTDRRDGNKYEIGKFGGKVWTIENLRYIKKDLYYKGAWIYPYSENDYDKAISRNEGSRSGVLYNWNTAVSCCPNGWELPSVEDWALLVSRMKSNNPEDRIGLGELNLTFDGYARSKGNFCIFGGVTFWTSTRDENNPDRSYVIIIQIMHDASLNCRFETQSADNAFPVRLIRAK